MNVRPPLTRHASIQRYISAHPGCTASEISKALDLPRSSVLYSLGHLLCISRTIYRRRLVTNGRYLEYWPVVAVPA